MDKTNSSAYSHKGNMGLDGTHSDQEKIYSIRNQQAQDNVLQMKQLGIQFLLDIAKFLLAISFF